MVELRISFQIEECGGTFMNRTRRIERVGMMVLLAAGLAAQAFAGGNGEDGSSGSVEAFLKDPLYIIVPYPAGGGADVANRVIAQYLADELGTEVVVENMPGAGGTLAATQYLTEPANTNRIIYTNSSIMSYIPMVRDVEFSREDFEPFFSLQVIQFALYAAPAITGIDSMEKFKEFASNNRVVFGSPGVGTPLHDTQEYVYDHMGADNDAVAYSRGNEGIVNLISGDTHVMATSISLANQFVEDGSIVPLAVLSENAYDGVYGQIPSINSFGYNVSNDMLTMYATSKGTDGAIVGLLYEAFINVINDPAFRDEMAKAQSAEYRNLDGDGIADFLDEMDAINSVIVSE